MKHLCDMAMIDDKLITVTVIKLTFVVALIRKCSRAYLFLLENISLSEGRGVMHQHTCGTDTIHFCANSNVGKQMFWFKLN